MHIPNICHIVTVYCHICHIDIFVAWRLGCEMIDTIGQAQSSFVTRVLLLAFVSSQNHFKIQGGVVCFVQPVAAVNITYLLRSVWSFRF